MQKSDLKQLRVPRDLYNRAKSKAALQDRPLREVIIKLLEAWLAEAA